MKYASKFFLIISAGVLVLGIVLCFIGNAVAASSGVQLFSGAEGRIESFVDTEASKITLTLVDADVTLSGGAEDSYIQIKNYADNMYSFKNEFGTLIMNEYDNWTDMLKFWDSGVGFNGMRQFLSFGSKDKGDKEVKICIGDGEDIKSVNITVINGSVTVSSMNSSTDYNISVSNGSVELQDVTTLSNINIVSDASCKVSLKNCTANEMTLGAKAVEMTADAMTLGNFAVTAESGYVNADCAFTSDKLVIDITSCGNMGIGGGATFSGDYYALAEKNEDGTVTTLAETEAKKAVKANEKLETPEKYAAFNAAGTEALDVRLTYTLN